MGSHVVGFLVIMTLGAPVLVGMFWGAPLLAAELETGTNPVRLDAERHPQALARGQGWLADARRGGLGRRHLGPGGLVVRTRPTTCTLEQFKTGRFDITGIVPVAYALFAMALGITAGALLRRTLPAMAVTFAGFIAVRVAIMLWLRPHYMSAVTDHATTVLTGIHAARVLRGNSPRASMAPAGQPGRQWATTEPLLGDIPLS